MPSLYISLTSFSFSTQAQTKKANENSLLWEISGNGLSRPSYVYGTLHMMCESDFTIKEKVKKAFDKSTKLALELDFDEPSEVKAMQEMSVSKVALSTLLTPEDYKKLEKKTVIVEEFQDNVVAKEIVQKAIEDYNDKFIK